MSDMTTTLREFNRHLARHRRAAAQGHEILIRDRTGATFVFKRVDEDKRSMSDMVGHLAGRVQTGRRVKSLAGYGRR